jgi:flagellar basal body-associated protein FliL
MQLNSTISYRQALRKPTICSQYLRSKVSLFTTIRNTKRRVLRVALPAINCLVLITSCVAAGILFFSIASHAAEKDAQQKQQKQAAMPMDLMELLGELGDEEADLDAAMSSVENKQATKTLPQSKPITTENSNKGARK